jgi:hypothetical protein
MYANCTWSAGTPSRLHLKTPIPSCSLTFLIKPSLLYISCNCSSLGPTRRSRRGGREAGTHQWRSINDPRAPGWLQQLYNFSVLITTARNVWQNTAFKKGHCAPLRFESIFESLPTTFCELTVESWLGSLAFECIFLGRRDPHRMFSLLDLQRSYCISDSSLLVMNVRGWFQRCEAYSGMEPVDPLAVTGNDGCNDVCWRHLRRQ